MENEILGSGVSATENFFESYAVMKDGSYYVIRLDTNYNPVITILNEINNLGFLSKATIELDKKDAVHIVNYLNDWLIKHGV